MNQPFSRETLKSLKPRSIHPARSFFQADVYEVVFEGKTIIVKDFSKRDSATRLFSLWIIKREIRALKALGNLKQVPNFLGQIDQFAFCMEKVEGKRLCDLDRYTPKLFNAIEALYCEIHQLGVTHNDVRRTNILIDDREHPHIIDFATAVFNKKYPRLFKKCREMDRVKFLRLKQSYVPDAVSAQELALIARGKRLTLLSHIWRKWIYRPVKPVLKLILKLF